MSMVVISDWTMCCTDCGGFHFLAREENGKRVVTHSGGHIYVKTISQYPNFQQVPCPNIGKRFTFPEHGPTLALEEK